MLGDHSSTLQLVDSSALKAPPRRPYLFLALDCGRPRATPLRMSLADIDTVDIGRGYSRRVLRSVRALRLDVPDPWMSSSHARLSRVGDRWVVEDLGSKNGIVHLGSRADRLAVAEGQPIEIGVCVFLLQHAAQARGAADLDAAELSEQPTAMRTLSPDLGALLASLAEVARSRVPILVLGETGTGKEVTARGIHELSGRPGPFQAVNCGALPLSIIEGELFGSVRGAYSDAAEDRVGLIRASDGGTLFLDEIAELPTSAQTRLLRVLQESEVTPIGSSDSFKVDLRVVAATNADLDEMRAEGAFRDDLYARVAGYRVQLPALHERREDLGLLTGCFLQQLGSERAISLAAARALFSHDWPRNIRELEHTLRSADASATGATLELEHLPERVRGATPARPPRRRTSRPTGQALAAQVKETLARTAGNVSATARELRTTRAQVHRWAKRFGFEIEAFRPDEPGDREPGGGHAGDREPGHGD